MKRFKATLFSRRGLPAWGVLVLGLVVTQLVWSWMLEERARSADAQFELHSREVVEAIDQRLRNHEQILLGGAGLFDASGEVSRAQWRTYVERLLLKENYPGIQGVGFSKVIAPADLAAHIATVRAEGFPAYTVKPEGDRPLYTSIIYLEPFTDRNLAAFGYDMFSQPTRRLAMRHAVERNRTSISGKVKLVQETHGKQQAGFLMYVPVYRPDMPVGTSQERWRALLGFVYSPYRVENLMHGILGSNDLLIDFTLHDGEARTPDSLMYDSSESHASETARASLHAKTERIEGYGQAWTLTLRSRPAFEARFVSALDWLVPVLGLGISLSLAGLMLMLLSRREQAMALAADMMSKRAESEERFHQLFLHMGQGVVIHQADGIVIDANPAAERILGLSVDAMRASPVERCWQAIHEDGSDFPTDTHPVMTALHNGKPVEGAVMGVWHPHQSCWRWLRVDAYPRGIHSGGQTERVYAVFSDITDERAAIQEARQARKFLSDVLSAASEISVIATDTDGLITVFNAGAERMLGYTADEMVGKRTPAILHLSEEVTTRGAELGAEYGRIIEGFRVFVEKPERIGSEMHEWTYVHKDGHHIPVSLVVTTMRNTAGRITGYLGIAEDITDRRHAERALREQAQHTQAIVDNMVDGIITIDQSGIIDSYNPAAERIFGYAAGEAIGQNVRMLMPNPHRDAHDGYLRNYLESGVARVIGIGREVEGQRKDGSLFPMELAISEVSRQGRRMFVGMVRDITERKRIERMKSEFVSTVSHELRTPLTSISGALGLVAGGALGVLPEQAGEMIAIAHKNSKRLTHLINDLLDMEKLTAGKMQFDMQSQPLMPLVRQAIEDNQAYGSARRVSLVLADDAINAEVRVDGQRLLQVLSNLLSNAIKFSPEDDLVEVSVVALADSVRVTVADHGPGIPASFRDRIFQKFAQADASDTRQKGGTGLGLAISRELIERMGGQIGFESIEDEGARFYFELPLWNTRISRLPVYPASVTDRDEAPRILVVEDEPDVARLLALMLTRAGYQVDTAATGAAALEALQHAQYAALTLDLMLPDVSGLGLIRQLRLQPETAGLPIVVVSAKMEDGRLAISGDYPGIDWLAKPIDESRLLAAVGQVAAQPAASPARVLHIEDDTDLHCVVRSMAGSQFDFTLSNTLQDARVRLAQERFNVVILDLGLPDGSGWDLLPEIRTAQPEARVVILSGADLAEASLQKVEAVLFKSRISPGQLVEALGTRIHSPSTQGFTA